MISPSFGFRVKDYGRLSAAGVVIIGQSLLEIVKIALGITIMGIIAFYEIVAFIPNKIVIFFKTHNKKRLIETD